MFLIHHMYNLLKCTGYGTRIVPGTVAGTAKNENIISLCIGVEK